MILRLFLLISLIGINSNASVFFVEKLCRKKQIPLEKTPYAIDIFCEDALGTYIGIVYRGVMGAPKSNAWAIENRYWQDKAWSSGVMSYQLIDRGNNLLVSTSDNYGEAGIYLLRLNEKKWKKIYSPKKKDASYLVLKSFDEATRKLIFKNEEDLIEITVDN